MLILAPEAYLPLRQVGLHYHASTDGMEAAQRVFAVLDTPPPDRGRGAIVGGAGARPVRVRLDSVCVSYPDRDRPAVRDVDLDLGPGELVALVGPSGSGKSTLLGVLLGFVPPTGGRVVVGDGNAAVDLAELDPDAWRRAIAWVPQRPALVAGTIADNVRLGDPSASAAAVRRALAAAAADEIDPDLLLGEDGAGLSAGQRQRIALARALLRDASLLLLDEPTAHLDPATEERVIRTSRALAGRRTVLLVAHSPALAAAADRVVRLDHAAVPA